MANNTTLNTMTGGDVIADEDISGVKYQKIKLVDGTAASTALIGGDATNGLDVDVTRIIPGTGATNLGKAEDAVHATGDTGVFTLGVANEAGIAMANADGDYTSIATDLRGITDVKIRQPQFWVEANVPGVAAAVYAAGDQFGTLISISNAARFTGGGGFITGVTLFDDDDLQVGADVFFYNDTLTLAADNAVFAISDADARKRLWMCQLPYFDDTGAQRTGQAVGLSVPYFCTATTLYVAIRTQSAVTPTATGVRYRISMLRD